MLEKVMIIKFEFIKSIWYHIFIFPKETLEYIHSYSVQIRTKQNNIMLGT